MPYANMQDWDFSNVKAKELGENAFKSLTKEAQSIGDWKLNGVPIKDIDLKNSSIEYTNLYFVLPFVTTHLLFLIDSPLHCLFELDLVTVLVVILLLVVELFELDVGNELLWAFL
jgi:hypothetical protein